MTVAHMNQNVPPVTPAALVSRPRGVSDDPCVQLDWFLQVTAANPAFVRSVLRSSSSLEGTSLLSTVHVGDLESLFASFSLALTKPSVSSSIRLLRADGKVVTCVCEIAVVQGAEGADTRFDVYVRMATVGNDLTA